MYPAEAAFSIAEQENILRIRQLIGDNKETFVDDVLVTPYVSNVKVSGTMYELEEPKGYPTEIFINGVEVTSTIGYGSASVLSYKFLRFIPTSGAIVPPLNTGNQLVVVYDHFRYSDVEILQAFDYNATTYLVNQCGLDYEDLTIDLLILATAFILLSGDMYKLSSEAVELEDSDSVFRSAGATGGLRTLMDLMKIINDQLLAALNTKMRCKMMSLPIYKVE